MYVCVYVCSHTCIHTYITYSIHGKLYGQSVCTIFNLIPQLELHANSRYSTHPSSLWTKPEGSGVDAILCTSISEVHVCMCVCVQSLKATRVHSYQGQEHLKPPRYRPLTYRGAVPGLPESCCVALGQPNTPAAKRQRLVGWRSMGYPSFTIWAMETTVEAALDLCINVM